MLNALKDTVIGYFGGNFEFATIIWGICDEEDEDVEDIDEPKDFWLRKLFLEFSCSSVPLYLPFTIPLHKSEESYKMNAILIFFLIFFLYEYSYNLLLAMHVSGIITEFSKFRFFQTFSEEFTSWGEADDDKDEDDVKPLLLDWYWMLAAINAIALVAVDVHDDVFEEQAVIVLL
jgi:hypothetical protein